MSSPRVRRTVVTYPASSSSFWNAKNGDNHAALGLMDRQRVKMWLRDVYRDLDDVGL